MKEQNETFDRLIAEAYVRYRDQVFRFIRFRINEEEEAEDLTQDVFVRLMDCGQLLCEQTINSFIFTIARNLVTDHLRRHYKWQEISSYMYENRETCAVAADAPVVAKDLAACERRCLRLLPPKRSAVYRMVRYEDKSPEEVALELHLSRRTVENHIFTGRKQVRNYMRRCI